MTSGCLQDDSESIKQALREQSDFVIPSEPKILRLVYLQVKLKMISLKTSIQKADIPRAMLTKPYVFIIEIFVLPNKDQDRFKFYIPGEKNTNWYNDENIVGCIR